MPSIEQHKSHIIDYTLYRSSCPSADTIVFVPGMACNRYGHPVTEAPKGVVEDIVNFTADTQNIIFPDIHQMSRLHSIEEPLSGIAIAQQNERIIDTLKMASEQIEVQRITFIAQSLGCLAVAALASAETLKNVRKRAVLLGAPTLEGVTHRKQLISMFQDREKTCVDYDGTGQLEFGDGKLLNVGPLYWGSIDSNSLRIHADAMKESFESTVAYCAEDDHFYPNNTEYLTRHAPNIEQVRIPGKSHTFKTDEMRILFRKSLKRYLSSL